MTAENEAYYSDMLIYIRLQLTLSEQQSEEVLMEMLDHLLDGQEDGKTAKDIFGHDPKSYADEIIEQLPKEKKREVVPFLLGIAGNIISCSLIIRGILLYVLSQFVEVNWNVNLFVVFVSAIVIAGFIIMMIWFIFKLINQSLFKEKHNTKKDMLKAGLMGAAGMAAVLATVKFTPNIGPSFHFSWWLSLLIGGILLGLTYVLKKR
nr:DUF1129 family protein [Bacillus sp. FJAT-50079]